MLTTYIVIYNNDMAVFFFTISHNNLQRLDVYNNTITIIIILQYYFSVRNIHFHNFWMPKTYYYYVNTHLSVKK